MPISLEHLKTFVALLQSPRKFQQHSFNVLLLAKKNTRMSSILNIAYLPTQIVALTNGNSHSAGATRIKDWSLRLFLKVSAASRFSGIPLSRFFVLWSERQDYLVIPSSLLFSAIHKWYGYLIVFSRLTERIFLYSGISLSYDVSKYWNFNLFPTFEKHCRPVEAIRFKFTQCHLNTFMDGWKSLVSCNTAIGPPCLFILLILTVILYNVYSGIFWQCRAAHCDSFPEIHKKIQ